MFRATLTPLKQQKDGWTTNIDTMSLGGVPSSDWRGEPHENGACTLTYNAATGKMDVLWSSGYTYMPLSNLHEVSNAKRVKEDQKTLKNLGQKILEQGWTLNQLRDALAIPAAGSSDKTMRIADYYQLKNGVDFSDYSSAGFKLESNGDKLAELLRQIGYDGGSAETSPTISNGRTSTIYENSLFYSDQLASNQYADSSGQTYGIDQNKRCIILEKISTDKNGKITGFTIFTKAMDGQANMGDDDKKLFRFDIK